MAGNRTPGPILDVPNADALLTLARRFSAAVSAARLLHDIALKAADLPDALAYNPGDGVVKTILTLAAHAPDPEQLAAFAELLLQLKSALAHQLARNEVITTDDLTGDVTAHTTTSRTPRGSLSPRPAPRPHPYVVPQEHPVTDDQAPADQPAPSAGDVAPADLSDEELRAETEELEAIMRDENGSLSQGTPEQESRWKKLLFESMDRSNTELATMNRNWEQEDEQRRQADEKAREAEAKEDQMWARIDAAKAALDVADSTDAGTAALHGLTRTDLQRLAGTLGIPATSRETKAQLQQHLLAATVGTRLTPPTPAGPVMSPEPLLENGWGGTTGEIHYHFDSAIGTAIKRLGPDAHLQVEGGALANVLGRIATSVTHGDRTSRDAAVAVRRVREQVPPGSAAARALDTALQTMDTPEAPAVEVPDGTPDPLRQLMNDLQTVPSRRGRTPQETRPEQTKLSEYLADYAAGRLGVLRLQALVRGLTDYRHESEEGFFEIEGAVTRAVAALRATKRAQ